MMVSTATDVLPVPRSPMISSRWPRPSANRASIVRMPVCTGCGDQLAVDDGGRRRPRSGCAQRLRPAAPPSSGRPSGSTTRPSRLGPTGVRMTSPVPRTRHPASIVSASSSTTQPIRSRSRVWTKPNCPRSKRSTSSSRTEGRPEIMAMPSPMVWTRPNSSIAGPTGAVAMRLSASFKP